MFGSLLGHVLRCVWWKCWRFVVVSFRIDSTIIVDSSEYFGVHFGYFAVCEGVFVLQRVCVCVCVCLCVCVGKAYQYLCMHIYVTVT